MLLPICFLEEMMKTELQVKNQTEKQVTIDDVNRVLEVGRLLFSVLTPEEIEKLEQLFSIEEAIGNTGDS